MYGGGGPPAAPDWLLQPPSASGHAPPMIQPMGMGVMPGGPMIMPPLPLPPPAPPGSAPVVHSRHLWLGNLTGTVTDAELRSAFGRFGDIDGITTYAGRNYAFVNMKTVAGAVAALGALSGAPIGGPALRLEFAKTGTPSRVVVVTNLSRAFTRDQWAAQFARYGQLQSLQFNDVMGSALVEYSTVGEAVGINNALQGMFVGGQELKVAFEVDASAPGQPPRASAPVTSASAQLADGERPTTVLWIGLPGGTSVNDAALHAALAPCGGLERVKTFPDRNYAFAQFHSVDAAAYARNMMQGRMVGDARLTLKFSNSKAAGGGEDHARTTPGAGTGRARSRSPAQRGGRSWSRSRSPARRRGGSRSRSRSPPARGGRARASGWDKTAPVPLRPLGAAAKGGGPQGSMPPGPPQGQMPGMPQPPMMMMQQGGPMGHMAPQGMGAPGGMPAGMFAPPGPPVAMGMQQQGSGGGAMMGGFPGGGGMTMPPQQQQMPPPPPGMMMASAPQGGMGPGGGMMGAPQGGMPPQPGMSGWAGPGGFGQQFDAPPLQIAPPPPPAMPVMPVDPRRAAAAPAAAAAAGGAVPVESGGPGWRGTIAKSGTPVCGVACVRGVPGALPPSLNCTARTDLNNLAAHLSQVPFRVLELAPSTSADVGPLQEFVAYLLERQRAGVAKAGDTTLFLVPPSEWAGRVLRCEPTANLLGVVVSTAVVPAAQPAAAAAAPPPPPQQQGMPTQAGMYGQPMYGAGPPPQMQQQQPGAGYGGAYVAPPPVLPSAEELARLVSMASGGQPR